MYDPAGKCAGRQRLLGGGVGPQALGDVAVVCTSGPAPTAAGGGGTVVVVVGPGSDSGTSVLAHAPATRAEARASDRQARARAARWLAQDGVGRRLTGTAAREPACRRRRAPRRARRAPRGAPGGCRRRPRRRSGPRGRPSRARPGRPPTPGSGGDGGDRIALGRSRPSGRWRRGRRLSAEPPSSSDSARSAAAWLSPASSSRPDLVRPSSRSRRCASRRSDTCAAAGSLPVRLQAGEQLGGLLVELVVEGGAAAAGGHGRDLGDPEVRQPARRGVGGDEGVDVVAGRPPQLAGLET